MRCSGHLATSWCRLDLFSTVCSSMFREIKHSLPCFIPVKNPVDMIRRLLVTRVNNFLGRPPALHVFAMVHNKAVCGRIVSPMEILQTLIQNKETIIALAWNYSDEVMLQKLEPIFREKFLVCCADRIHRALLPLCPLCKRER